MRHDVQLALALLSGTPAAEPDWSEVRKASETTLRAHLVDPGYSGSAAFAIVYDDGAVKLFDMEDDGSLGAVGGQCAMMGAPFSSSRVHRRCHAGTRGVRRR